MHVHAFFKKTSFFCMIYRVHTDKEKGPFSSLLAKVWCMVFKLSSILEVCKHRPCKTTFSKTILLLFGI